MRVPVRPFPTHADRLTLAAQTVEVWQASLDAPPVAMAELEAVLAPEERARGERFKHLRVRDRFVRARGLLRVLLGRYLGCPAAAVPVGVAPDGKPVLTTGGVEFNISHTGGLVVIAVAGRPVGVDIEAVREVANADALVERFFTAGEAEQYRGLPAELRPAGFFRGWTCKEAVLKGIGCGTRDLGRCVVDVDPRRPPRVVGPPETAAGWSVAGWVPQAGSVAAVAVTGARELELRIENESSVNRTGMATGM
ncbi:MAG TPA: 4'-phosphopantetheinyl transferase superfamily protein [Fimbriiglobus sp.]|nr:4'-phosphopantetheinyl transferase superfamily protein [Fimbriiglobus sp.]